MRPSIRLASLMQLKAIYIMTHDSIGLGEDGPTHQPVEHLSSLRSMPNLNVFRPADALETLGVFLNICKNRQTPSLVALSRQTLMLTNQTKSAEVSGGAYFLNYTQNADISIFASGSELSIAKEVCDSLTQKALKVNLISVPCMELFYSQDQEYIAKIIGNAKIKVAIEAASSLGWHKIIGANGLFFGVEEFGRSAPAQDVYSHFGLNPQNILQKIIAEYENRN
jgi:transketolase